MKTLERALGTLQAAELAAACSRDEHELLAEITASAIYDARQNKPDSLEYFRASAVNWVATHTQDRINENWQRCPVVSGRVAATKLEKESLAKVSRLHLENDNLDKEIRQLKMRSAELNERLPKLTVLISYIALAGLCILALCEGGLSFQSWRFLNLGLWAAVTASAAVAIAAFFGAEFAAVKIKKASSSVDRAGIVAVCLILSAAVFYGLSSMRSKVIAYAATSSLSVSQSPAPKITVCPCYLALLSFALFWCAVAAIIKYRCTAEDFKLYREHRKVDAELQAKILARSGNASEIRKIEERTDKECREVLQEYEQTVATEQRIVDFGLKLLETYCSTNMRHRSDGVCPPYFSSILNEPIKVHRYFIIKNQ